VQQVEGVEHYLMAGVCTSMLERLKRRTPPAIVEAVRGFGLEGVVAKRKDSLYEPDERSDAWQKLKLENQQEFVIGGYRPESNGIDALTTMGPASGSSPASRRPSRRRPSGMTWVRQIGEGAIVDMVAPRITLKRLQRRAASRSSSTPSTCCTWTARTSPPNRC
jgi:hypothetical protein